MIRLVKSNIVRGIISYDVYLDREKTSCSVIVRREFEPQRGRYQIISDGYRIVFCYNGMRVGEIRVGNGLYKTFGCIMHCGILSGGVLCVMGQMWMDDLLSFIDRTDKVLVIA